MCFDFIILDSQSYKHPVNDDDLEAAKEYSISKPDAASSEFIEFAQLLMAEAGIQQPTNADEGLMI